VDFRSTVSFFLLRLCCLAKITTMRVNFFKVIGQNIVVSFPEVVRDNVISNDVTIMSSLHSDVIMLGINFLFS